MKIEILDDWNTVLGGCDCCEMPECPLPSKECESISDSLSCGYTLANHDENTPEEEALLYTQVLDELVTHGSEEEGGPSTISTLYTKSLVDGSCVVGSSGSLPSWLPGVIYSDGYTKSGTTYTKYYEETPYSYAQTRTITYSAPAEFGELEFADQVKGAECIAEYEKILNPYGFRRKTRFKWVVPDTWEGSYFKISWDIAFFPEGYDAEDPGSPQPELVNSGTWEWTGPGNPEDEDSWKSGWYEIDPPEEPGETRIVNVRYECYRSTRLGIKPQITGEAYGIPT